MFFVLSLCAFSLLAKYLFDRFAAPRVSSRFSLCGCVALLCYAAVVALLLVPTLQTDDDLYLDILSIYLHPQTALIAVVVFFGAFFLYRKMRTPILSKLTPYARVFDALVLGVLVYLSFQQMYLYFAEHYHTFHFSVLLGPAYALENGGTIGITVRSNYGFYIYLLYYLQRWLFGKVTAFLLCCLIAVTNALYYAVAKKLTRSRAFSFVCTVAIIFFTQFSPLFFTRAPYYQYTPIRTLMPAAMCYLLVSHLYDTAGRKKLYGALAVVLCGLSFVWNPETGLMASLCFFAYMVYTTLQQSALNTAAFWRKIAMCLLAILASYLCWFGALQLLTFLRSGQFLSVGGIFWSIFSYSADGLSMIPLPENHPYPFVLIAYGAVVALALAAVRLWQKKAFPSPGRTTRTLPRCSCSARPVSARFSITSAAATLLLLSISSGRLSCCWGLRLKNASVSFMPSRRRVPPKKPPVCPRSQPARSLSFCRCSLWSPPPLF